MHIEYHFRFNFMCFYFLRGNSPCPVSSSLWTRREQSSRYFASHKAEVCFLLSLSVFVDFCTCSLQFTKLHFVGLLKFR